MFFQPSASSSSGSAGAKNYLGTVNGTNLNGDFETGGTTGWALGNVSALTNAFPTNNSPTFGSGNSGNLSIATISSGQLAGTYSLSYASSAASTLGDFLASNAITIDIEDQAKVMSFKFYYTAHSGAVNANWSGTTSNSFGVAIWDVTNSVWIQPAGCFGMTQSSGIGYCTGTWQTPSNMTQFRFVVYNSVATTGAATLYFDDFFCGPQTAPFGPAVTDWAAYTPTFVGMGSVSGASFYWRRVGTDVFIRGNVTTGTVSGSTMTVSLPSGLTAVSTISSGETGGTWARNVAAAQAYYIIRVASGTTVQLAIEAVTAGFTAQTARAGTDINSSESL